MFLENVNMALRGVKGGGEWVGRFWRGVSRS